MVMVCPLWIQAQRSKRKDYFEIGIAPSVGFKVMGKAEPFVNYYGSKSQYRDSLNKADGPLLSLAFSARYYLLKTAVSSFSIGLHYTDLSFRRTRDNPKLGDIIHPDPELIVAGLIQTGSLSVNYDYHWRYLEVPVTWYTSIEQNGSLREMDIFFFGGVSAGALLSHRVLVKTIGFTVQEKDRYSFSNSGFESNLFNVSAMAGVKLHYFMFQKWNAYLRPMVQVPLLPVAKGMQTVWVPQFRVEAGFTFPLFLKNQ